MIRTQGLGRRFGEKVAVEGLDLEAREGEVLALLGPNGAGKTTTVRMLSCILSPTSGTAWVAGHSITAEPGAVRQAVGVLTESPGLYRRLSARRNLEFFGELYGVRDIKDRVEKYLRFFGLWERRNDPVGTLSKGMRQKLALARALLHDPKVLLLDEPTAGLDPESARAVRDFIQELKAEGRTVLLCTHNLPEAEELADRIALLRTRLIALGTPRELKERFSGARVVVELLNPHEGLVGALDLPEVRGAKLEGNELWVEITDPRHSVPALVRRLVELGAEILEVRRAEASLEEVYLKLMEGSKDAAD